ncbi:Tyrocidine synthetase 3 [Candidatus Magnetomorum sp. HK-1]|nr:Tyrocidine synthetase 3 [Candidatus Magnetomorum sp. HK-1]
MNDIINLLTHICKLDIKLWVEEGRLRYNAPKGAFTNEIRDKILKNKPEIIEYLSQSGLVLSETEEEITIVSRNQDLPLSSTQERLWFLYLMDEKSFGYNVPPTVLQIKGSLDIHILKQAVNEIIKRHEILRTNFNIKNDLPVQIVSKNVAIDLTVIQIQHLSETDKQEKVKQVTHDEAQKPFDLVHDPLLRISLIQTNLDEHVIILSFHHIVFDGWSLGIFVNELIELYKAYISNNSSPLPALEIQYADYACWQKNKLSGKSFDHLVQFWKQKLADAPALIELPTDYTRPPVQSYNGNAEYLILEANFSEKLKQFSTTSNVTLFMTLLSAFSVLLYRYTEQDEIVIGTAVANRKNSQVNDLIGCFLNSLALRIDLGNHPNYQDLLAHVKQVSLEAFEYQDLPFEKIVEVLRPERDMRHSPIFQVMFVLQNAPLQELILPNLSITPLPTENVNCVLDLTLSIEEKSYGMECIFKYNTDLFSPKTIQRMKANFHNLLKNIISNPDQAVNKIPLLSSFECNQLQSWNHTIVDYPSHKTIVDLFEEQVHLFPDHIALVFENVKLTYTELNERANQLAHFLRHHYELQTNDIIGIILERSENLVIAVLGIMKSDATHVLIDLEIPYNKINTILEDSHAKLLITQSSCMQKNRPFNCETLLLDQTKITGSTANPIHQTKPDHILYLVYTSGTTGNPKGTLISHNALFNYINWMQSHHDFTSKDSSAWFASVSFDGGYATFWGMLLCGGTIHVISENKRKDAIKMVDYLYNSNISFLKITPSFFSMLLYHGTVNHPLSDLNKLRVIHIGGEKIITKDIKSLIHLQSNACVVNHYGPAEATIGSIVYPIQPSKIDQFLKQPVIGKPIYNTKIYIVDKHGNIVPIGVYGEICVSGDNLSEGYLNRPELTKEKFQKNPFDQSDRYPLMYRTGDIGRWLPDGNIELVGRNDDQIKIRGYRIEIAEIQTQLIQYGAINEIALVIKDFKNDGNNEIAAYFTSPITINSSHLREYLKDFLSEYMIPSYFIQLDQIPINPNGKIDKKALPDPGKVIQESTSQYLAPQNETEAKLVSIWQQVLNVPEIGITDNFFDLGGHSLNAIKVVSLIHRKLNAEMSLKNFFTHPTIKGQAAILMNVGQSEFIQIKKVKPADFYPVSNAQRRLWILDKLEGGSTAYNMPAAIVIKNQINHKESLNIAAIKQSFIALITRHESLRTVFPTHNNEPVQKILEHIDFQMPILDLTNESLPEKHVKAFIHEDAVKAFDLNTDLLLRVSVLKTAIDTHIIVFNMHHIISDGISMGILVRDFTEFYNAIVDQRGPHSRPLSIQYKDYSSWQNTVLETDRIDSVRSYWLNQLSGDLPVLNFPSDFTRSTIQTFNGDTVHLTIPSLLLEKTNLWIRTKEVSLFIFFQTVLKVLLYKYTGQNDILMGSPVSGRNHIDLEDQIGLYVNTLVFRNQIDGSDIFVEFLQKVKQTSIQAYDNQIYPFDKLVEELELDRDLSRSPIFDIMLIFQNIEDMDISLNGYDISYFEQEYQTSKFDLTFIFLESKDNVLLNIEYNTDLFQKERIENIGSHFIRLMESVLANPEQTVSDLDILTEKEKDILEKQFNNTAFNYNQNKTIVDLFQQQVEKTPGRIAVIFEQKQLTYKELNELSNQLAHYLKDHFRILPDDRIGLLLDRSEYTIIGILGILKAGGAYVPVDLNYPEERIQAIIEDSFCKAILVDSPKPYQNCINIMDAKHPDINNLDIHVLPHHLTYLMYTSGSTGKPKGVMITHQNIVNFNHNMTLGFQLSDSDTICALTTTTFDISVLELINSLLTGMKVVILGDSEIQHPDNILNEIVPNSISVLQVTPSRLKILMESRYADKLNHLRVLLVGGEVFPDALYFSLKELCPDVIKMNVYGPTEATIWSTCRVLTDEKVNIGSPLINESIYILTNDLNLAPMGMSGEICISGDGLGRGYHNLVELTKDKFMPHPFCKGKRLYKTGDLGRWLPDGSIELFGRNDDQVKIRGYRIELEEIERQLLKHNDIKEAIVVAKQFRDTGNNELAAYLISYSSISISQLRDHLKKYLPDYMIPSCFIKIEKFPLTPNGKINKKALPEPSLEGMISRSSELISPRDHLEIQLVEIWEAILNISPVGIRDDFFELGGQSMIAVRMMSLIEKKFQTHLPLSALFQGPTIEQLANLIRINDIDIESQWSSLVPIQTKGTQNPFFCVPGAGGNVLYLYNLARRIGSNRAFYGLQPIGLDGKIPPHQTVADMASHYINEIKKVQPDGEYIIGGHSFGGIVAYEMSQQLIQQGHKIAKLIILDMPAPQYFKATGLDWDDTQWLIQISQVIARLVGKDLEVNEKILKDIHREEQLEYIHNRLKQVDFLPDEAKLRHFKGFVNVYQSNLQMAYQPDLQVFPVNVALFKSRDLQPDNLENENNKEIRKEVSLGWNAFLQSEIEHYTIPGDHLTMLNNPHVQTLAEKILFSIDNKPLIQKER